MKSLNFTHFKEKLLSGEKKQTIRCLFIPNFEEKEIIQIKFKKEFLFYAEIKEIYPRKMSTITLEESLKDGFKSILQCQKKLLEINRLKSLNHYCFIIRFNKIKDIEDWLG